MSNMPKIIFMDMDGTLLNGEKDISPKTKTILKDIQKKTDTKLVIISGRSLTFIKDIAKLIDLDKSDSYLIGNNGASIYSYKQDEVIYKNTLSQEEVNEISNHLSNYEMMAVIHTEDDLYIQGEIKEVKVDEEISVHAIEHELETAKLKPKYVDKLSDHTYDEVFKILSLGDYDYIEENLAELKDKFHAELTGAVAFEYTKEGVNKGSTINHLLNKLDIDQVDTIAFGDNHNDISMFNQVGKGIAMANAVDELKEVASAVTNSNTEDGIYEYLVKIFTNL